MTTQTMDRAIGEYVGRCMEHVRDLSDDEQAAFLDDIRQILTEVTAELEGDPDDLLGPPKRFVSELRNAAGLPALVSASGTAPLNARPLLFGLLSAIETRARRSLGLIDLQHASAWLRQIGIELRPAWWVGRAFLMSLWLGVLTTEYDPWGLALGFIPIPHVFGSVFLGLVSFAGLAVASIILGRRNRGKSKWLAILWTIGVLLFFGSAASSLAPANTIARDTVAMDQTSATTYAPSNIFMGVGDAETMAVPHSVDVVEFARSFADRQIPAGEWWVEFNGERIYPDSPEVLEAWLASRSAP